MILLLYRLPLLPVYIKLLFNIYYIVSVKEALISQNY